MNKYGVENFMIEELEYVDSNSELSEREIYWDILVLRYKKK